MQKRLIYIVDDEPAITEPLAYALATDGFEVESFTLAHAFQQRFSEKVPDLAVLDVGLPDMNGFELFRLMRSQVDVPVLFLTARGDEIDRVVGLELGADDYVVKPFSPREVAARIRVILKRCHPPVETASDVSTLRINREAMSAYFFNTLLDLTKYEFCILAQLAEHPSRVFSRAQLMDNLWPDRSGSMERTIDTHIKTLRSKLKQINPGVDLIKTHRGFGYSLELR